MNDSRLTRRGAQPKGYFNIYNIQPQKQYSSSYFTTQQTNEESRDCRFLDSMYDQENIECTLFKGFFRQKTPPQIKINTCIERQVQFNVLTQKQYKNGISVRSQFKSSNMMIHGNATYQHAKKHNKHNSQVIRKRK